MTSCMSRKRSFQLSYENKGIKDSNFDMLTVYLKNVRHSSELFKLRSLKFYDGFDFRTTYHSILVPYLEQMKVVETSFSDWKSDALTVMLHLHVNVVEITELESVSTDFQSAT